MTDEATASRSWSRRHFLAASTGVAITGWSRRSAAAEPREVVVPHLAFGSIVSAIVGPELRLQVDPSLPVATFKLGGTQLSVAERLLLKSQGHDRRRYLDDARNAPKLGAAVRDHLRNAWPEEAEAFTARHRTWSRSFVRDVLRWTKELSELDLRDKRVRDEHGRIYLLEWAGARTDDGGSDAPAGLASAPDEPTAATPAAYREYIQQLIDSTF
ncbi:MAG: hypothetical protein AAF799_41280 [Myxococcota bacterium]